MATPVRIGTSQADDLSAVCAIGARKLYEIAKAISSGAPTIKRQKIRAIVHSMIEEGPAAALCAAIFGLSALEPRKPRTLPEVVDGISLTLQTSYSGDPRFNDWAEVSAAFLSILECESVYLTAKAFDVSYDFERVLTGCRIVTGIRPVYNEERDTIVGSTIVQTLRLEYDSNQGLSNTISISLDVADVAELEKVCRDALIKASVAKSKLETTWERDVIMPGEVVAP